jgi:hypothetical protein
MKRCLEEIAWLRVWLMVISRGFKGILESGCGRERVRGVLELETLDWNWKTLKRKTLNWREKGKI